MHSALATFSWVVEGNVLQCTEANIDSSSCHEILLTLVNRDGLWSIQVKNI